MRIERRRALFFTPPPRHLGVKRSHTPFDASVANVPDSRRARQVSYDGVARGVKNPLFIWA